MKHVMTLVDASDVLTPILRSKFAKTDEVLKGLLAKSKQDFRDNPVRIIGGLNQISYLDNNKVDAINEIVARYELLTKGGK